MSLEDFDLDLQLSEEEGNNSAAQDLDLPFGTTTPTCTGTVCHNSVCQTDCLID
ncbi:FDLD family class I lanthipeptide [Ktedonosporobacter rubrisoli]|uniref:FDLD family class I lanthipeptide n=1 Tax=Ktedonosporobacter rubrisoli TaxID=2509675 RepID=UPI0013EE7618|nr:FDLD family class I lanthipeptide [Ktedonosporobacter rubrisoli]